MAKLNLQKWPLFLHDIIRVARSLIAFSTAANATYLFVNLCLLVGATLAIFELLFLVRPALFSVLYVRTQQLVQGVIQPL